MIIKLKGMAKILQKMNLSEVGQLLGHKDIKTTMIYAKTDDELKAQDIKKISIIRRVTIRHTNKRVLIHSSRK